MATNLTTDNLLPATDPSLVLPDGAVITAVYVETSGGFFAASPAQVRAILTPPPIISSVAPGSPAGPAGQEYRYKRTSSAVDWYLSDGTNWVKQFTTGADSGTIFEIVFNAQAQSSPVTITSDTAGTYTLPTSGVDVQGVTNPQYYRDGTAVSGTAQFVAGNVLTVTATTTTGGKVIIRQQ